MRNKTRWLALGLVLCLVLAGCGGSPVDQGDQPSPTVSPDNTPAPDADNAFLVSIPAEPEMIDPTAAATAAEMEILPHLFEGLMKWSPSNREAAPGLAWAQVEPGMAKGYEKLLSDDGRATYTFRLRPAKWSDGKAVTAHDFVYSWQRLMNPANHADYAELLADCVVGGHEVMEGLAQLSDLGVRAVDDTTFEVTLLQDVPWFLELCALPVTAPVRQDAVEGSEKGWTASAETYLTNGPYRLAAWEEGYMALEKNPEYYDKAAGPDTLMFIFQDGTATDLATFQAGTLDFLQGADPAQEGVGLAPYAASYYLMFQTQKAPFDNPLVRQAFALAIDRTALVEDAAPGQIPAGGLVPTGVHGSDGAAGADFRTRAGNWLDPSEKACADNREKAKALLRQAGYPGGAGFPAVSYLCPENTAHQAVGQALCEMWQEALGVEVSMEAVDWTTFLRRCHQGDYFMARGRWVAEYNDPISFLGLWHSQSLANDAKYQSGQFDQLLERASQAADPSARMDALVQTEEQIIAQDWALAPLYYETQAYFRQDAARGVCYTPLGSFVFTHSAKK